MLICLSEEFRDGSFLFIETVTNWIWEWNYNKWIGWNWWEIPDWIGNLKNQRRQYKFKGLRVKENKMWKKGANLLRNNWLIWKFERKQSQSQTKKESIAMRRSQCIELKGDGWILFIYFYIRIANWLQLQCSAKYAWSLVVALFCDFKWFSICNK